MAMNQVQFQKGLSMTEFMAQYGSEAKCRRALFRSRWPKGFRCPACQGRAPSRFRREGQIYYQCRVCRHQTTLLAGTVFEATKLPLRTWFLAIHLLTSTKTNMAALELKRHLGVTYRTAWRMKHKVMEAMMRREESRQLSGFVQIDDAYLGGERNGGKPGRGSENKQAFVIAVETDEDLEHPTFAVIEPVRSFDNASITDWAERRLAPMPRCSVTGWAHSVASPIAATPTRSSRPMAAAPPPKRRARGGSTWCSRTSNDRWTAPITQSNNTNMRAATLLKRPTASTVVSTYANSCHDCCTS